MQILKLGKERGDCLKLRTKAIIDPMDPYKVTIKYTCTNRNHNGNVDSGLRLQPIVCLRLGYPIRRSQVLMVHSNYMLPHVYYGFTRGSDDLFFTSSVQVYHKP